MYVPVDYRLLHHLHFTCKPIIRYVPIFKEYVREFLLSSIADGISYVEPRVNFVYK